ncbi:hypothetical protein GJ496_005329 [Pomphorhynchus laevis]|nr:hypothetical protein GJ496_005329 [Pomphorhynchus laevis]
MSMTPVSVYCYLRPLSDDDKRNSTAVCCEAIGPDTIVMTPPTQPAQDARSTNNTSETRHIFRTVFTEETTQSQLFLQLCIPVLTDVLTGRDALLFTYGVSGSGKTYSMTGTPDDPGLLPRSIDAIFNSIVLLEKYCLSRNSQTNEFNRVTDADRMLERQRRDLLPSILNKSAKRPYYNRGLSNSVHFGDRVRDDSKLFCTSEHSRFSVFVSYVEVYNRYIYDLLDNSDRGTTIQTKNLREDKSGRMFVRDAVEVEVRSADEAIEILRIGNSRRHFGKTDINTSSSRSHAVFTIRLVRIDTLLKDDENIACVSQLSMVDMAGSERSTRAHTEGHRLKEAGHINTTLLVLRNCFKALQLNNQTSIVPYRDSKLTTLFKHFFEGYGRIVMLLCINPSINDYDENVHVMKFAEASQQVKKSSTSKPLNIVNLKPTAPLSIKRPLYDVNCDSPRKINRTDIDNELLFSGTPPSVQLAGVNDENTLPILCEFLDKRSNEMKVFLEKQIEEVRYFRNSAMQMNDERIMLKSEINALLHSESLYKLRINDLENQLSYIKSQLQREADSTLKMRNELDEKTLKIRSLTKQLEELKQQHYALTSKHERIEHEFNQRVEDVKDQARQQISRELLHRQMELSTEVSKRDNKLRRLRDIITSDDENSDPADFAHFTNCQQHAPPLRYRTEFLLTPDHRGFSRYASSSITTVTPLTAASSTTIVPDGRFVSSARQQKQPSGKLRWRSADLWLDHRPRGTIQTDGILQPIFHKRRSVSCISLRTTLSANKYALTDQHQTREGELITRLVKGEILASRSGGANVIFTDVETVHLLSPSTRLKSLGETDSSLSAASYDSSKHNERHHSNNNSGIAITPRKR